MLYISYGETDEWAHSGHYKDYLNAANLVDKWIQDIWNYVQNDPFYKNKTAIFITTDHGRGDIEKSNGQIMEATLRMLTRFGWRPWGPAYRQRVR